MRERDVIAVQKGPISRKPLALGGLFRRITDVCKHKIQNYDKIICFLRVFKKTVDLASRPQLAIDEPGSSKM